MVPITTLYTTLYYPYAREEPVASPPLRMFRFVPGNVRSAGWIPQLLGSDVQGPLLYLQLVALNWGFRQPHRGACPDVPLPQMLVAGKQRAVKKRILERSILVGTPGLAGKKLIFPVQDENRGAILQMEDSLLVPRDLFCTAQVTSSHLYFPAIEPGWFSFRFPPKLRHFQRWSLYAGVASSSARISSSACLSSGKMPIGAKWPQRLGRTFNLLSRIMRCSRSQSRAGTNMSSR